MLTNPLSTSYSNKALIEAVLAGDREGAASFYRRFGKRISGLVWSLLGADRDHDDMVQSVFANVLESLHSIKNPSSLHSWVDSVTFRTVRLELRRRRYRNIVIFDSYVLDNVLTLKNPVVDIFARRFYAVADKLKPDDRMVFLLRYFDNASLSEISEISGWSVATVKRRLKRAKASFRRNACRDTVLASALEGLDNVGS